MGILKPEMTKIPIRFGILAFTALLLLLSAVEATKPIENLGTWNASRPLGKMTRLEACGGPVVGPYLTLFWSEDQLMLVRESAWNNPDKILWKINALTQLRGAVYFIQRLKNCNSRHPETIYVVAALSPSYWMLTCDSAGCLVIDGPKPTPSSEKIEFIREATFPVIHVAILKLPHNAALTSSLLAKIISFLAPTSIQKRRFLQNHAYQTLWPP